MTRHLALLSCGTLAALMHISSAATAADLPPAPAVAPIFVTANVAPNLLGTNAVPIRADRFTASWERARQDASAIPLMQRLVAPARNLAPLQQIAFVQSAITANIRWVSDTTQWGQHDYWASASETLAHGAGDMEDRAIVKMQALRALGFKPSDLYLTLARDKVAGAMTVLTVRHNGRYLVLDDTGGAPFVVDSRRHEFQPVISFGWNGTWVHARAPQPPAVAAASITRARK